MHDQFVKQAKKGNIDLLFIGDSITEYWRHEGKDVWQREFSSWKPGNFGIAGDTTHGVMWRVGNGGELVGLHPKAVVLLIGTNDISNGLEPPAAIASNVGKIVQSVKANLPQTKVIILAVFPRSRSANDPVRGVVRQLNEELAKLQNGKDILFLDIGLKFLSANGDLSPEIMPDYLHLSRKGYEVWANAMRKTLEEVMQ